MYNSLDRSILQQQQEIAEANLRALYPEIQRKCLFRFSPRELLIARTEYAATRAK